MTYRPPQFREDDPAVLLPLVQQFPFATLASVHDGEIAVSHIPLLVSREGDRVVFEGHIARANPQWRAGAANALATFTIASHYISPSWYPSKLTDPRTVPTYDYVIVEARGRVEFVHDEAWLRAFVRRLTATLEPSVGGSWRVDDAPADYLEAQAKAIVGLRLRVDALTGIFKLNQHHPEENKEGILRGLTALGTPSALGLAAHMGKK